jgi:hypothetical protein
VGFDHLVILICGLIRLSGRKPVNFLLEWQADGMPLT